MKKCFLLLDPAMLWSTMVAPNAQGTPIDYVALGDSHTSAPGMLTPTPGSPPLCTRSVLNYPNVLAAGAGRES